jgi:signal transduction histidine kinase
MLQLANLRSAVRTSLSWVELDLAESIRRAVAHVRPMAQERGIVFQEDLKPAKAIIVEDHVRMLFANLLHNAIIYSNEKGGVQIICRPDPQQGQIVTIEDHGIGIPEDKLPKIFDDYYRTNEALRHNKISTGLGLAIVRHVADTHGIRIRVESCVGSGTKFILRFPPTERFKNRIGREEEER